MDWIIISILAAVTLCALACIWLGRRMTVKITRRGIDIDVNPADDTVE